MSALIPLPESLVPFLEPYLPNRELQKVTEGTNVEVANVHKLPFVTLTYAQSLDSKIAIARGVQTKISHLETKTMTHYIRSRHDAILIGISTLLIDNPSLNCRFAPSSVPGNLHKIRPIIIDPSFKCFQSYDSLKVNQMYKENRIEKPIIVINSSLVADEQVSSRSDNYNIIALKPPYQSLDNRSDPLDWNEIFTALNEYGVNSVMVEGGARIINDLLVAELPSGEPIINSLIITVAPKFLGDKGVDVSPCKEVVLANEDESQSNLDWWKGKQDSVLAVTVREQL